MYVCVYKTKARKEFIQIKASRSRIYLTSGYDGDGAGGVGIGFWFCGGSEDDVVFRQVSLLLLFRYSFVKFQLLFHILCQLE